ncbi:hypothetical protein RI129_007383 [Pyrocoelia pectoralis]|uniref:Mitochondrial ribonuclease P catalytic subunit n=1 Tax=Pyrocoelia pectoralis TaxID=417401 RepID=A0AAN7ZLD0_9COLE
MSINNLKKLEKILYSTYSNYRSTAVRYSSNCSPRRVKIEKENKSLVEEFVPNTILHQKIKTLDDWESVREKLLNSSKQISHKTIDSIILSVCISSKNYDLGFTYLDFLKQRNISLGLAAIGKYFKLFYLANCNNSDIGNEDEIYNLYKTLRAQYKVFDAFTCDNIIHALSITSYWRECLILLDEIKISCGISKVTNSVVAAACFKNGDEDLGWKLLNECANKGYLPQSVAYLSYINASEHSNDPIKQMEKLFYFFALHDFECDNEVANGIVNLYHKLNLEAKCLNFYNSTKCKNCGTSLTKLELTPTNFEELKTAVVKNVIIGSDVFYKSTPTELEQFKQFTTNMKNYDVVIDGLNVAYAVGTKQPPQVFSFFVKSVVKHFVDRNKKVLLLGRTHMQKWPKMNWSYVTENSDTFLTQSLSHDDPYLLYCALHCGVNTIIVSKDLMRSHLFKISDIRLKILFNRWLLQNQYHLSHINNQGKVFFKYPPSYSRTAQKFKDIWHIPYSSSIDGDSNGQMWVCLNNKVF